MIIAKCTTFNAGYNYQRQSAEQLLEIGREYEVVDLEVGSSSSTVLIQLSSNKTEKFNTVFFEFFEDGEPANIYRDKKYSEYWIYR